MDLPLDPGEPIVASVIGGVTMVTELINTRSFRAEEIPAAGAIGDARSLARRGRR